MLLDTPIVWQKKSGIGVDKTPNLWYNKDNEREGLKMKKMFDKICAYAVCVLGVWAVMFAFFAVCVFILENV